MSNPDLVEFSVGQRHDEVRGRADPSFFQGKPDHRDPFPRCERVLYGMAMLGTPNDNNEIVNIFQYMLDGFEMS